MSVIVSDAIFLRRPKFDYICPPVCETFISGSSFAICIANAIPQHCPPVARIEEEVLFWEICAEGPAVICYNIYKAVNPDDPSGAYEVIFECVPGFRIPVDPGCYRVSAVTLDGESELSNSVCTAILPPEPPTVETHAATGVGETSATLNGTANPNRSQTDVFFEWGTDTSYGNVTPAQDIGTTPSSFSEAISGLTPGVTYHFRAVATNAIGTAYGEDMTFTTPIAPCSDSEVDDWATRIIANGGTVSADTLAAACEFMTAIKAAGLRSKMFRVNLFAGDQFAAALVPLIKDMGHPVDQQVVQGGTVGPSDFNYSETGVNGGVQPVTTNAYINPGVTADALPITNTSVGLSFYDRGRGTILPNTNMGALHFNSTTQIRIGNSIPPFDVYGIIGNIQVLGGPGFLGLDTASRVGNNVALYEGGSLVDSGNSTPDLPAGDPIDIFSFGNGTGSNIQFSNNLCAGYAIHAGLTAGEVADFAAAFQTFNTALSRQE